MSDLLTQAAEAFVARRLRHYQRKNVARALLYRSTSPSPPLHEDVPALLAEVDEHLAELHARIREDWARPVTSRDEP